MDDGPARFLSVESSARERLTLRLFSPRCRATKKLIKLLLARQAIDFHQSTLMTESCIQLQAYGLVASCTSSAGSPHIQTSFHAWLATNETTRNLLLVEKNEALNFG